MNLLGCHGSSVIIARFIGVPNISMVKKTLIHDSGVCDERAL